VNQCVNPLKSGTGSNLVDAGRAAVRANHHGRGWRLRSRLLTSVGRPSRNACGVLDGEAAAAELGADPINRDTVNVGTAPGRPTPRAASAGTGRRTVSRRPRLGTEGP